jgi:hypothetical protein
MPLSTRRMSPLLLVAGALAMTAPGSAAAVEVAVACPSTVTDRAAARAALDYWTIFDGPPEDGVALAPDDEQRQRWDFTGLNADALRLRCVYAGTTTTRTLALPRGTQRCEARGKLSAKGLNGPMVLHCTTP